LRSSSTIPQAYHDERAWSRLGLQINNDNEPPSTPRRARMARISKHHLYSHAKATITTRITEQQLLITTGNISLAKVGCRIGRHTHTFIDKTGPKIPNAT